MGIGSLGIAAHMGQVLEADFSSPLFQIDLILLAPKPKPLPLVTNLVRPFSSLVWATVFGCAALVSVALFVVSVDPRVGSIPVRHAWTANALVDAIFVSLGCLCSQGAAVEFEPNWLIMTMDLMFPQRCTQDARRLRSTFSLPCGSCRPSSLSSSTRATCEPTSSRSSTPSRLTTSET